MPFHKNPEYECRHCQARFISRYSYHRHLKACPELKIKKDACKCPYYPACTASFPTSKAAYDHGRDKHTLPKLSDKALVLREAEKEKRRKVAEAARDAELPGDLFALPVETAVPAYSPQYVPSRSGVETTVPAYSPQYVPSVPAVQTSVPASSPVCVQPAAAEGCTPRTSSTSKISETRISSTCTVTASAPRVIVTPAVSGPTKFEYVPTPIRRDRKRTNCFSQEHLSQLRLYRVIKSDITTFPNGEVKERRQVFEYKPVEE